MKANLIVAIINYAEVNAHTLVAIINYAEVNSHPILAIIKANVFQLRFKSFID